MEQAEQKAGTGIIPLSYFQGHRCNLPADRLSLYKIKCSKLRKIILDWITVETHDKRARNIYKSYAAFCAEKYRHFMYYPLTIHPFSKLRLWLEIVFVISIILCYTILPIHFSEDTFDQDLHGFILYVTDISTICNIVANFLTGYVEGYTFRRVVLDPKKICLNYCKTWLIIDLLCAMSYVPHWLTYESINVQVLLVSIKLLRIPVMFHYISNINAAFRVGIILQTCVEIFLCVYLYLMWNVLFQFAVEYVAEGTVEPTTPRNCSWLTKAKLWNATTVSRFVYAFDRAVAMFRKTSYNELGEEYRSSNCYLELFYMISWFIAKFLMFHCGLKYIIAVYGAESAASKYFRMRREVEMYMNQRKFPPRIKEKILKFYAVRYQSTSFVEERILPCVSGQLREDIIMHTGRQLVRELAFMKQLPRTLLLQISFQLKLVIFIAGDIVYKINNIGNHIYFIDKGTIALYSESGKEVCHLEDGDFFGEIALVTKHRLRITSAVAVGNCELFTLDRDDFNNSIACYPTVYDHIKTVATRRYERTSVLDDRHKTEMRNINNDKKEY